MRPVVLSYSLNEYYACWVRKFHFSICQLTTVVLPKLSIYLISDTKNNNYRNYNYLAIINNVNNLCESFEGPLLNCIIEY